MATTQDVHAPALAAHGQPCSSCGAPMAGDQRYCLQCGARRGDARVPYREILAGQAPPPRTPIAAPPHQRGPSSGLALLVGLVCLLLALGVGALIGRSGNDPPTAAAPSPPPQVISVGGAAPAATTPAATTPTTSTTPTTTDASSSSSSKAKPSSHDTSKSTNKSVKDLDNSSGSDYQKKSQKLPKQLDTGGKPPPKDNKPAGGGTDFQTIG
jgi:hypothetical protein